MRLVRSCMVLLFPVLTIYNRLVTSATTARLRFSQGAISDSIYFLQETRHLAEELEDHIFAIEQERVHNDAVGLHYYFLSLTERFKVPLVFFSFYHDVGIPCYVQQERSSLCPRH